MGLRDQPALSDMQGPLIRKAEGKIHGADLRAENISGHVQQLFFLLVNRLSSPWLSSEPVAWCKHRNVLHQGLASVLFTVLEKEFPPSLFYLCIEHRRKQSRRCWENLRMHIHFLNFLLNASFVEFLPPSHWCSGIEEWELVLSHRHLVWGGQNFHQSSVQTSPTSCFRSKLPSLGFRNNLSDMSMDSSQLYCILVVFILLLCCCGFIRLENGNLTIKEGDGSPSAEDLYKWPRVHSQLDTIIFHNQECSPVKGMEVKWRGNLPCTLLHCG